MGRYPGPGWTDQPPVIFSDQPARGRWVVVQKNSPGVLNIAEIYVSTDKTSKYQLKGQFSFNIKVLFSLYIDMLEQSSAIKVKV